MTFGVVIPLTPNPVPVMETAVTVRSALPVFEIVKLELLEEPVTTLPKLIELLLREICGLVAVAVAVRFTVPEPLPLSPCTVNVPLSGPAAVGFTPTVMFADWPEVMVIGRVIPLTVNCALETVACMMVSEAVPELEMVTV
jgi:hypothetical protein